MGRWVPGRPRIEGIRAGRGLPKAAECASRRCSLRGRSSVARQPACRATWRRSRRPSASGRRSAAGSRFRASGSSAACPCRSGAPRRGRRCRSQVSRSKVSGLEIKHVVIRPGGGELDPYGLGPVCSITCRRPTASQISAASLRSFLTSGRDAAGDAGGKSRRTARALQRASQPWVQAPRARNCSFAGARRFIGRRRGQAVRRGQRRRGRPWRRNMFHSAKGPIVAGVEQQHQPAPRTPPVPRLASTSFRRRRTSSSVGRDSSSRRRMTGRTGSRSTLDTR